MKKSFKITVPLKQRGLRPPAPLPAARRVQTLHVSAYPSGPTSPPGCYLVAQATDGTMWLMGWGTREWSQLPALPSAGSVVP